MKIVEYKIVYNDEGYVNVSVSFDELTSVVNDYIHTGWVPLGNLECTTYLIDEIIIYFPCQAMVKYDR